MWALPCGGGGKHHKGGQHGNRARWNIFNLPVSKSVYYGTSEVLKSIPAEEFNTWKLAYRYAVGSKTAATAKIGTVTQQQPLFVECAQGSDVLAEVTVKGGMSYVPLTFTGVPSAYGYELEKYENGQWVKVDQVGAGQRLLAVLV